ncbi:RAC-gamma serine/threonine-protein kinase [Rhizophlyctis rosea]|uniref:RAC-gamma serine/threonine-protein kinase n=1 Tax=Rhizophlyctis rosea TaxID=64517 RepID=A0AAD5WZS5_9FUNG|nr:RAC-gamma serine/threonine-protein kinase [Rhizophlyctis rosea]
MTTINRPSSRPGSRPLSPQPSNSNKLSASRPPPSLPLPDTPASNEGATYWYLQGSGHDDYEEEGLQRLDRKASASQETITRFHQTGNGSQQPDDARYGHPSRQEDPSPRSRQNPPLRVAIPGHVVTQNDPSVAMFDQRSQESGTSLQSTNSNIYARAAATIANASQPGSGESSKRGSFARSHTFTGAPTTQNASTSFIPQNLLRRASLSSSVPSSTSTTLPPSSSTSTTYLPQSQPYQPALSPVTPHSPYDQTGMPLIPAPPLPYSTANVQRKRLSTVPRKTGNVSVTIFTEDDACNVFVVPPNTTVNEVRMEALVKLGYAELTESFRMFHMEGMPDGHIIETRVDPNTPVDFFLPSDTILSPTATPTPTTLPDTASTTAIPRSETFTSLASAPSLTLRMRRKSTVKWNVPVFVEKRGTRNVIVDAETTVEDVLKVLFTVEAVDEGERSEWGLWKELTVVGDAVLARPMALKWDDKPFEPWERTVKFLFRRMAAKRAAKLSSVLGIPSNVDPHLLMDKGSDIAQDVKRRNEAYRSAKLTKVLGITSSDKKAAGEEVSNSEPAPFPAREKRPPMRLETFDSEGDLLKLAEERREKERQRDSRVVGGGDVEQGRRKSMSAVSQDGGMRMPVTPNTPMWKLDALEADLMRTMSALSVNEEINRQETANYPQFPLTQSLSRSTEGLTSVPSTFGRTTASTGSRATTITSDHMLQNSRSADLLSSGKQSESGLGPRSASAFESSLSLADKVPGLPGEVGGRPWGKTGGVRNSFSSENFQTYLQRPEVRRTSAASILSTSTTSSIGEPKEPAKRTTGKLAEFFGVQKGQKEMDEIRKIVVRNQEQRVMTVPDEKEKNTFVARIYFGNLTYTSISLPIATGTASSAIKSLLDRLNIKENSEQYAVFEYQQATGAEREVKPDEKMYDIMRGWENSEIFVFKRRATRNLLRHKPLQTESGIHTESSESSHIDTNSHPSAQIQHPAKRVAKLAGFFGVQPRPIPLPQMQIQTQEKGARSMEVSELCKMLNVMSDDTGAFKKAVAEKKVDKIYKEGWLHKYHPTKRTFTPHWGKIENCTLTLHPTVSKDEVIPSLPSAPTPLTPSPAVSSPPPQQPHDPSTPSDQITITISLQSCAVESAPMSYFKRPAFQVMENSGEKHSFAVGSVQEVEEWINSIKVSSRLAGRKTHAEIQVEEYGGQVEGGGRRVEEGQRTERTMERRGTMTKMSIADFEIHKVLGRGKFAKVLLCSQKSTQKVYAIKVLHKHSGDDENSRQESQILRSVQHPFIVGLYYAFQSKERLYLVMEYINGGELYFHVSNFGRFSEERVRFYGAEILLAVDYLHEKDVVYRDLKLENILLAKDGHVKITDFGLSKQEDDMEDDMSTVSIVGTLEYLVRFFFIRSFTQLPRSYPSRVQTQAPEVLEGLENSFAADWWAYGVVLFEMLCGFHPFYSDDREMIRDNIISAEIEYPPHVTSDARDLISKLLNRNPMRRLGSGSGKGREIMGRPFYASVDFGKLYRKEIEPPFKPELVSLCVLCCFFDELFTTEEPVLLTPTESQDDLASRDVDGFSFRGHSYMDLPYNA